MGAMEKKMQGYEDLLREKDKVIEMLRLIEGEYAQLKGRQLLSVMKTGINNGGVNNTQNNNGESIAMDASEELQLLKQ